MHMQNATYVYAIAFVIKDDWSMLSWFLSSKDDTEKIEARLKVPNGFKLVPLN